MRNINPVKAGLATGVVLGLWHLTWALFVALNWAQPVMDFVLRIHFMPPFIRIVAFDSATAAILVVFTTLVGFLIGSGLALAWNQLHAPSRSSPRRRAVHKAA